MSEHENDKIKTQKKCAKLQITSHFYDLPGHKLKYRQSNDWWRVEIKKKGKTLRFLFKAKKQTQHFFFYSSELGIKKDLKKTENPSNQLKE